MNFKLITSACSLQEIAKVIATNCDPMLLFDESLEFIKNLELMDKYVGIPNIIDQALFHNLVRIRRLKIESELKVMFGFLCKTTIKMIFLCIYRLGHVKWR